MISGLHFTAQLQYFVTNCVMQIWWEVHNSDQQKKTLGLPAVFVFLPDSSLTELLSIYLLHISILLYTLNSYDIKTTYRWSE